MTKLRFGLLAALLSLISISIFANRVVITQQPVMIEKRGDVYFFPSDVTDDSADYYYVAVDGTNEVCYFTRPSFVRVAPPGIRVSIRGAYREMYCVDPNTYPDYFEVHP